MVLKKKKIKKRKIEVSSKPIVNDKPKNYLHISDEELPDEKQVKANLDLAEEKKKKKAYVIAGFNDDKPISSP